MEASALNKRDLCYASNESVHRSMNEVRVAETSIKCECECHRAECGSSFEITVTEYEAVRAQGRWFIVAPDHQSKQEAVISRTPVFWVIEKLGEQGDIAEELNPR